MQIFLVGGAVRNQLLNIPITDKDWVVVGSTPDELKKLGYKPVGKDFPVFLHPKTHEEYALARTERKVAKGYQGFKFYYAPDVTLTEDLGRRDLTINAMALDNNQQLVDPYYGQNDLKKKYFRHVSSAFAEDPVRILRVARFASYLPDFTVHASTNALMKSMVKSGEVDALVPERVWKELSRALENKKPTRFFEVLMDCDAHARLWSEIDDSCLQNLNHMSENSNNPVFRFSALCFSFTQQQLTLFVKKYKVPNDFFHIAKRVISQVETLGTLDTKDAEAVFQFLNTCDALRQTSPFLSMCEIGVIMTNAIPINRLNLLRDCIKAIKKVDTSPLVKQGLTGLEFKAALKPLQINRIERLLRKT